jgi:hypothetical protein
VRQPACGLRITYSRDAAHGSGFMRKVANDTKCPAAWLLRLIAERAGIQTIVLDNEGEFSSLREAVDVLFVGASGELPANPRQAALLARRLLEFKVSAVVGSQRAEAR